MEVTKKNVTLLMKTIFQGNGKPALVTIIAQTNVKIEELTQVVYNLSTNVSALVKFQTEIETEKVVIATQKEKKVEILKQKNVNKRWLIGLAITIIIAVASCIIYK